jgi:transcriptional antiterminator RfaH
MSQSASPTHWYLIQSKPRQEARAEEHLMRQNFECFRPLQALPPSDRRPAKGGASTPPQEALFPGYLFIRLDQINDNWYPIRSTRGVSRIVTFGGRPLPVQDALIHQIRDRLAAPPALPSFKPGDVVLIKTGDFCDIQAIFLSQDGERRAMILLNLLQREQKISLPLSSLSALQHARG